MLIGLEVPGFRDSAYLYYPLFEWIDEEWKSGDIPLWNPYCNLGMPVVGDNSSSVFYPGKLIFFLRFLPFPMRYGLYIAIHYFIAAIGTFWLARMLRANVPGATLAAITYSGSGCLLSLASNVIFLVSAAWLPFALGCTWLVIREGEMRWVFRAGICGALMILGGDPQMVYHLLLIFVASTIGWFVRRRFESNREAFRSLAKRVVALGTMVAATVLLALVQIWPTLEWSRFSERFDPDQPVSVYQAFASGNADWATRFSALLQTPKPSTVGHHIYQFSLPPWSLCELLFPNASGKLYPVHQRWTEGLNEPDRVWYPSLYIGWITVWLAIGGFGWRGDCSRSWLSRILIFFLLGSLGSYGMGWLLNLDGIGKQTGGVYWWMTLLLPEYSAFRYPAKLFVIGSLCLSLLGGLQLKRACVMHWRPFRTVIGMATLILFLGVAIATQTGGSERFNSFLLKVPNDPLFGPLDQFGSLPILLLAVSQPVLLFHFIWYLGILARISRRLQQKNVKSRWPAQVTGNFSIWLVVIVTSCDLWVANRWILGLVPSEVFTAAVRHPWIETFENTETEGPLAIYRPRDGLMPKIWSETSSEHRLQEIIRWQRETHFPKHHLVHRNRVFGSFASIWPTQYETLLQAIERQDSNPAIEAADSTRDQPQPGLKREFCDGELVQNLENDNADLQYVSWRASPQIVFVSEIDPNEGQNTSPAKCNLLRFKANEIELLIEANRPCRLVHRSFSDGNWAAEVIEMSTKTAQHKRLRKMDPGCQGIDIDQGNFRVRLYYDPKAFWRALWISSSAWCLTCVLCIISVIRKTQRRK